MNTVEIKIGSQVYLLKGEEDVEHLREVGELVRRRVESIRKQFPKLTPQKASMLAAFDLASEAIRGRKRSQHYRSTILSKASDLLGRVQLELASKSAT